jgi:hypothetical protein
MAARANPPGKSLVISRGVTRGSSGSGVLGWLRRRGEPVAKIRGSTGCSLSLLTADYSNKNTLACLTKFIRAVETFIPSARLWSKLSAYAPMGFLAHFQLRISTYGESE